MIFERKQGLQIDQSEVHFLYKPNQKNLAQIRLQNPSKDRIAFKILTTNPKRYNVRPYAGILEHGQAIEVLIVMSTSVELDVKNFDDKFSVQSVVVSEEITEFSSKIFSGQKVTGVKIRAVLEMPYNLGAISEIEDYQDAAISSQSKYLSGNGSQSGVELRQIGSSLSQVMSGLSARIQSAKQNENSMYNRSRRIVDTGVKKGIYVAGNLVGDVGEIMQKGKQAVSELKAGEKVQATKQFGGHILTFAGQQISHLGQRAKVRVHTH